MHFQLRAGGNGPAAPILVGPVFLKVKMKVHFYEKQVIQNASVIYELARLLTIIDTKSISRGARLSATHALCLLGIQLFKKLINEQSGSMIFRPVRLITLYYN